MNLIVYMELQASEDDGEKKKTRFYNSQNKYVNDKRQARIRFNSKEWINLVKPSPHPPNPPKVASFHPFSLFIGLRLSLDFSKMLKIKEILGS